MAPKTVVRAHSMAHGGITYRTQHCTLEVHKAGYSRVRDSVRNAIVVHLAHFEDRLERDIPSNKENENNDMDFDTLSAQYQIKVYPPSKTEPQSGDQQL